MSNLTPAQLQNSAWPIAPVTPTGCERPVSETLPAAVERIVRELEPEKIILFGSYAYGVPTPDSDVDLVAIDAKRLNTLSDYAVRVRYPGEDPPPDEAREAVAIAKDVRRFARVFLGIS